MFPEVCTWSPGVGHLSTGEGTMSLGHILTPAWPLTSYLCYFLDYKNGNNMQSFHLIELQRDQSEIMYENTLKCEKCIDIIIFTLWG